MSVQRIIKIGLSLSLCFLCCAAAQVYDTIMTRPLPVRQLATKHGLASNTVYQIVQDRFGFMWFGTETGLSRYDGYEFTNFNRNPEDPNSLSSNTIMSLLEGRQGYLWIGTLEGGLNRFDLETESFKHYLPSDSESYPQDILAMVEAKDGLLWLATERGLASFNPVDDSFVYISLGEKLSIKALSYDENKHQLWLATARRGLYQLKLTQDIVTKPQLTIYQYDPRDEHSLADNQLRTLYLDQIGQLWVGSTKALHRLNDDRTFSRYARDELNAVYGDRQGQLWLANQYQLERFDSEKEEGTVFSLDGLSTPTITMISLYQDRSGAFWVGTQNQGLYIFDPAPASFERYHLNAEIGFASEAEVRGMALYEDPELEEYFIWTTTSALQLIRYNILSKTYQRFSSFHNAPACGGAIAIDRDEVVWCASARGLNRYDPDSKELKLISSVKPLLSTTINYLYFEDDHSLWIAGEGGLSLLNTETFTFKPYPYEPQHPERSPPENPTFIYQGEDKLLWLGSSEGLTRFDAVNEVAEHFASELHNSNSLSDNRVQAIYQDPAGIVWIGTKAGLNRFDPVRERFSHYFQKDGLASDFIAAITRDDFGQLWISTNRGLSRFHLEDEQFRNYGEGDGLKRLEFSPAAVARHSDALFFGGVDGFYRFSPGTLSDSSFLPEALITEVRLSNTPLSFQQDDYLSKPIWLSDKLELAYSDVFVSFQLTATDYVAADRHRFRFRLDGLEESWQEINGGERRASYRRLPPGKFSFLYQASNRDGLWGPVSELEIVVTPPWWMTFWFRILFTISIFFTAYALYSLRIRSLRQNNRQLQKEVALQTQELANVAQVAIRASEAKGQFLAHMSHELRTPLNAILGYSQLLSKGTSLTDKQATYIATIDRSGEHLLRLVNNILEFRKIEVDKLTIRNEAVDLVQLFDNLASMFFFQAQSKNLKYTVNYDTDVPRYVLSDGQKLRQILINLLGNAFKFTNAGCIDLSCELLNTQGDNLILAFSVRDTGVGITPSNLEKIFEAFEQNIDAGMLYEGTGLGLSIARDYVKLMGGEIKVESKVGLGSCFTVMLQCSRSQASAATEVFETGNTQIQRLAPECGVISVLIVEDKQENRQLLQDLLQPIGFLVQEAADGEEALQALEHRVTALILMDMKMPRMDGFEATRRIRQRPAFKDIPIIAVTANAFAEDRTRALSVGCTDFISKPFKEKELLEIIAKHLDIRYTYEEVPASLVNEGAVVSKTLELTPQLLDQIPPDWFKDFDKAFETLDSQTLKGLVEGLESLALRKVLLNHLDHYNYEALEAFRDDSLVKLGQPIKPDSASD